MSKTDLIWKTEKRKIKDLIPTKDNPRRLTEKQKEDLKKSLEKFNLVDIPAINLDNRIISGHQRIMILKALGRGDEEIDVRIPNRLLTENEHREYLLRANKNLGEWDFDLLANFDEDLLKDVGFDDEDLDKIFDLNLAKDEFDAETEAETEYEKIENPKVKRGDLYILDGHRILCGDATDEADVAKLLDGEKADLVYCDPPYNVGYSYDWRSSSYKDKKVKHQFFSDTKKPEEYQQFIFNVFKNAYNFSKDYSSVYCWYAIKIHEIVKKGLQDAGWYISQTLIWLKNSIILSTGQDYHRIYETCFFGWKKGKKHFIQRKTGTNYSDIIMLDREDFMNYFDALYEHRDKIADYKHPTQKPVRLVERSLKRHSKRGHIILDLFAGSGSTLIACEQMKRKCYTMDIDPIYCELVINRWESLTGKKAKLLENNI